MTMSQHLKLPPKTSIGLILSYILDWAIIIVTVIVGAVFQFITPNKRPFSLTNPEISFPYVENEKISSAVLWVVSLVAPAIIILVICILLVPGPTISKSTPRSLIWGRKLWEWNTGWLGLGLSFASAFLITQGMKNLFGKPRPDLISRCHVDMENREQYIIGGFPNISPDFILYSAAICKNPDTSVLNDGFRSYPSGHASFSAAGLIYLSLFIASKFALVVPFLPANENSFNATRFAAFPSRIQQSKSLETNDNKPILPISETNFGPSGHNDSIIAARNQAAAPPVYLLVLAIIPWFVSIYISATRYSDFRHHGFDISFGYVIGLICAVFAFRYYHLPISQGAGWSWGPRSRERSFWAGVGVGSYVGGRIGRGEGQMGEADVENCRKVEGMGRGDVDVEEGGASEGRSR